MLKRALMMGLAAVALATWTPAEAQAQDCQYCFECAGGEHDNWAYQQSSTGNRDGAHDCWGGGCWPVHDNTECEVLAALDAVRELPVLDGRQADAILSRFADRVLLHPSRKYLQVLDCKAERVIAQFEVKAQTE